MKKTEEQYPEHDKLTALGVKRGVIQEFIDWIYEAKDWAIAERGDREVFCLPVRQRPEVIMAEFFEIDLTKLENEKRQMIDSLRKLNGA